MRVPHCARAIVLLLASCAHTPETAPAAPSVGVTPEEKRWLAMHAIVEERKAEILRLEGRSQGYVTLFDGGLRRGMLGFGGPGHLFSDGVPGAIALRAEGALQLGVGSTVVLTIREIGWPPGNGYLGIGTREPQSIVEISGEEAPRLSVTSSHHCGADGGGNRWQLLSGPAGEFELWNATRDGGGGALAIHVDDSGRTGIGTAHPSAKLAVSGHATIEGTLTATGGVRVATDGQRPACDANVRGMLWVLQAKKGADELTMCGRDAKGHFRWRQVNLEP